MTPINKESLDFSGILTHNCSLKLVFIFTSPTDSASETNTKMPLDPLDPKLLLELSKLLKSEYPGIATKASGIGCSCALGITSVNKIMSGGSPAINVNNSSRLFKN